MESCDSCEILYSSGIPVARLKVKTGCTCQEVSENEDRKRRMKEKCQEDLLQAGIGVKAMELPGLVCIYRASEHGEIPLLTLTPRQAKTLARSIIFSVDELFSDAN